MPLPDYRLVEEYENSRFAREAAERKKARTARATKAWSKKYGADYAKRKARNKVVTRTLTPAEAAKLKTEIPKKSLGNVKLSDQFISTKTGAVGPNRKTIGNKVVGKVAGEVKPSKVKFKTDPSKYTTKYGLNTKAIKAVEKKSVTSFTADSVNMSVKEYSEYKLKNKTAQKTAKTIVKVAAKGATRLIPGIGTALLIKDVYDVNKWAMSQPKKKKKDANIYGTVSNNKIYKGY